MVAEEATETLGNIGFNQNGHCNRSWRHAREAYRKASARGVPNSVWRDSINLWE
uniref:Uncharacterized protein n=1 Tax=Ulva partita TaxID=1605170 RepID=A0A1C9ZW97_9CHLO|nr:hypothetical protein [Ulva partita]